MKYIVGVYLGASLATVTILTLDSMFRPAIPQTVACENKTDPE